MTADLIARLTAIRLAPGKHHRDEVQRLRDLEQHCRDHGHTDDRHAGRCLRCGLVPLDDGAEIHRRIEQRLANITPRPADPADERSRAEHDHVTALVHGGARTSGIPAWHRRRGLADITPTPEQAHAHQLLAAWVADQRATNPKPRGILLVGTVGSGKTTLAAAAACDLGEPHRVLFRSVRGLIDDARANMGRHDDDPIRQAARARLLVLDDLGAVRDTAWRIDELRGLLDTRHDTGRATVATANLTEPQLADMLGERSWSRLASTVDTVPVTGPDRRRQP